MNAGWPAWRALAWPRCRARQTSRRPEGDGWLLTVVGRRAENRADLVILDALHLDRGPLAVVKFPCRVHEGFHGIWVAAAALGQAARLA